MAFTFCFVANIKVKREWEEEIKKKQMENKIKHIENVTENEREREKRTLSKQNLEAALKLYNL